MLMWLLSLLSLLVVGVNHVIGVEELECTNPQHKVMQEQFSECSVRYSREYHITLETLDRPADIQKATCLLLSQTIDICGDIWSSCHDEEDIRKMKDMHITGLVLQYSTEDTEDRGINVNQCEVVREYRESGREDEEEYGEDEMCTQTQSITVQNKFQTCSHSTSLQLHDAVMNISDSTIVTSSLCKALTTIGTVCVKILKECFSSEYVETIRDLQLEEMKDYLIESILGKVNDKSLSNCQVMKKIKMPSEKHESYENYDETNDISGNDQQLHLGEDEQAHVEERKDIQEQKSSSKQTVIKDKLENSSEETENNLKKEKVNSAVVFNSVKGTISVCFLLSIFIQFWL